MLGGRSLPQPELAQRIRNTATALGRRGPFRASELRAALGGDVSRQYVTRTLRRMVAERVLVRAGTTRGATYAPAEALDALPRIARRRLRNQGLDEDRVLNDFRLAAPFIDRLPENSRQILTYAFTEMLNNAIEHSHSATIEIAVWTDDGNVYFTVSDFGVGVFRNVMRERHLSSELEAIQDLLKGKITTAPRAHSGEGIFFTSKAADEFILESFDYRLRIDNTIKDVFIDHPARRRRGTRVQFRIARRARRRLAEVFRAFAVDPTEPAFDRSEVKVRLFAEEAYVSRSQARRLLAGLGRFRRVVLDFAGVRTVGQAFADEVFRVFSLKHPHVVIEPKNMNEFVRFMVDRSRFSETGPRES